VSKFKVSTVIGSWSSETKSSSAGHNKGTKVKLSSLEGAEP